MRWIVGCALLCAAVTASALIARAARPMDQTEEEQFGVRPLPTGRPKLQRVESDAPVARQSVQPRRRSEGHSSQRTAARSTAPKRQTSARQDQPRRAAPQRQRASAQAEYREDVPADEPRSLRVVDNHEEAEPVAYQTTEVVEEPPLVPMEDTAMASHEMADMHSAPVRYPAGYSRMRWWFRTEYTGWWGKGIDLPALVTTSTPGTPANDAGLLGRPTTQVLFGDQSFDEDLRGGIRFSFGYWLDPCRRRGVEAYFYGLEQDTVTFSDRSSGGLPILARPFFDSSQQQYVAQLLAHPAVSDGSIDIEYSTETSGAGALVRTNVARSHEHNVDFLGGYRYARLDDKFNVQDSLTSTATTGNVPLGTVVTGFDTFDTQNEFHGVDLGMAVDFQRQRWTLTLLGKCALGNVTETADINGSTSVAVPGAATSFTSGGLLTQPTNIGNFKRDKFTVIPEASVNVRYRMTRHWTATAGYNFIFWNDVIRADDQVDFRVNSTQIGGGTLFGPGEPEFKFTETDYWIQGVNAGLELQF